MAKFSGAVTVTDLNDFIAPSQACVVNLDGGKLQNASETFVSLWVRCCLAFGPADSMATRGHHLPSHPLVAGRSGAAAAPRRPRLSTSRRIWGGPSEGIAA